MPPQRDLPASLLGRPFRTRDAVAMGVSPDVLSGSRFRRPFAGIRAPARISDTLANRVDAALLAVATGSVVSHHTAAELRDLPVPAQGTVHMTSPVRGSGRRAGITPHVRDPQAVRYGGRLLSAPTENFLELAETLSLVDLVILGDAMVRRGFVSCEQLVAGAEGTIRRRGVRMARRAARLVRPRVDSPMETRTRLLIVLCGLPEPATNITVFDQHGQRVGCADLIYSVAKLIIEYDGDLHRTEKGKWRVDVATRESYQHDLSYRVIVLTADDIYLHPQQTLWRIQKALLVRGQPGVPAVLSEEWRAHLPPRHPTERPWS